MARNGKQPNVRFQSQGRDLSPVFDDERVVFSRPVRGITLRQITEDDMPFLFRLLVDPARIHLWMTCRQVYDERGFHQAWINWTADAIKAKFLVESSGRPIGLVYEYDRALEDGHTRVSTLLDETSVGRGGGAIAWALLVDWLFQTLPLRKVYMDVYAYNPRVARMLGKVGVIEEGVLKEMRFWKGAYWDLHIFSASRRSWPAVRARILGPPRQIPQQTSFQPDPLTSDVIAENSAATTDDCPSCVGAGAGHPKVAR